MALEPHEKVALALMDAAQRIGWEELAKRLEDEGYIEMSAVTEDGEPVFSVNRDKLNGDAS